LAFSNHFCQTGQVNDTQNNFYTCVATNYTGPTAAAGKVDDKGFVKCDVGEICSYTNSYITFEKPCECGYNSKGQGYCPLASGQNYKTWTENIQTITKTYNNECHSQNRFNCYKANQKQVGFAKYSVLQTEKAHLFYGAVDCASDVLGSAYINMSVAMIAVLFAFLF